MKAYFPPSQWQYLTGQEDLLTLSDICVLICSPNRPPSLNRKLLTLSQVTTASEEPIIPNHTETLILPHLFSFVACKSIQFTTIYHLKKKAQKTWGGDQTHRMHPSKPLQPYLWSHPQSLGSRVQLNSQLPAPMVTSFPFGNFPPLAFPCLRLIFSSCWGHFYFGILWHFPKKDATLPLHTQSAHWERLL